VLEHLEPLDGARVLDFACGAGVLSAWLADRGADVVGLDISAGSIARARELVAALGLSVTFVASPISPTAPEGSFDRICGSFALHHTDLAVTGPLLASKLVPGGTAAFIETMATNPLLRFARRFVGRFGVPRYGSLDEHPLTSRDLEFLGRTFGEVSSFAPELVFMRIFDRQLLGFRHRRVSRAIAALDDSLGRLGLDALSYQQVVVLRSRSGS